MNKLLIALIIILGTLVGMLSLYFPSSIVAQILSPDDPDINIRLRNPIPSPELIDPTMGLITHYHFGSDAEIDPRAPQLDTMFPDAANTITGLYQLHERDGASIIPANGTSNWGSTLVGFTSPNTSLIVPTSGYDIGGGYQVTVLYMDDEAGDLTLSYTAGEAGITRGYVIHFLGVNIPPDLVSLYAQGSQRGEVIALPCGYSIGTIRNELLVSIRDTGTFFDARSTYDWWQASLGRSTSPAPCENLPPILVVPGSTPGDGSSTGPREYTLQEIACTNTQDPEYHSLRPYPASNTCPANQATDGVWLCGQDLVVKHTYRVTPFDANGGCEPVGETQQRCRYNVTGSARVYMDLTRADLPIVGNTEDVPNAISSQSRMPDALRMNEYVSWYLNGVIGRAEEFFASAGNPVGLNKIINFSGPLRKLLPQFIQTLERKQEFNNVDTARHDQIIECGGDSPLPCYDSPENPPARLRVTNQGTEDRIQYSYTPFSSTEDLTSPITLGGPSPAQKGEVTSVSYTPITSPVSGDPNQSTKNLFFAHMQENTQLSELLQSTFLPEGADGRANSIDKTAELQQKVAQHCELLDARDNKGDNLYGENTGSGENSQLEIVRNGQTVTEPNLQGVVSYNATFECTMETVRTTCNPVLNPVTGEVEEVCTTNQPSCETSIPVAFSVGVTTPNADSLWDRLVGSEASIFRRIFPKIGPNTPIVELEDNPGKTIVQYGSTEHSGGPGTVTGNTLAGNPDMNRSGGAAELYFPHLGSVHEYFLQGIQEALRPKDIGNTGGTSGTIGDPNATIDCGPSFMTDAFGGQAQTAACIARAESQCRPAVANTSCLNVGGTWDYSIGLFQINLLAHPWRRDKVPQKLQEKFIAAGLPANTICKDGFSSIGWAQGGRMTSACQIGNQTIVDICTEYFSDPQNNKEYAAQLQRDQGWSPWATHGACGV